MEEIRGAAMAYYANMSEDQQKSYESFNSLMDANGDGKVSYQEYLDFIRKHRYNYVPSNLFKLLDENNRGNLYFEECVTLFYMITCNRFVFCCGFNCMSHLFGLHFLCVECYRVGKRTYNLCSSCYRDTNYDHEHFTFLDNYDLLHTKPWEDNTLSIASGAVGSLYKRATMEDLVKTARIYYNKSSSDIQIAAYNFFKSLDNNSDGKVSLHEFLGFMRDEGYVKMGSSLFFEELDKDKSGSLEFMEVMALYYIIKSGRPFCCGCDEFIPGMYFTCSICFDNGNNLFCVCPNCFQGENFRHEHNQFLDNYALLEAKRMQGSGLLKASSYTTNVVAPYQPKPPTSSFMVSGYPTSTTTFHVTNNYGTHNVVPPDTQPEWPRIAFKVLETGLITAAGQLCTIM